MNKLKFGRDGVGALGLCGAMGSTGSIIREKQETEV